MPRIRLIIQYDGTNYVGWQTQPNGIAVQEVIEKELQKLTGVCPVLHASGRTDSGVHALAQVAHFDTDSRIPAEKFCYALNVGLPRDIRILHSDQAEGFHSRFDVIKKHYRYTVNNGPHAGAFDRNTALHYHYHLDENKMQRAADALLGEHDFAAFKSTGTDLESTVRTIYSAKWSREGNTLRFDISGSGFMYNMVRIIVGTMLEIGSGRRDEASIAKAIQSCDRSDAGATAPAHGLMLYRVEYPTFDTINYTR